MSTEALRRTPHQRRVDEFMVKAKQDLPDRPTMPDEKTRRLRAKLIIEEALETVRELGFRLVVSGLHDDETIDLDDKEVFRKHTSFETTQAGPSLEGVADGCADIMVVTTGTLSACGIADDSLQREVDFNNLAKFGPGHSWNEYGKLVKPPNHKSPNIYEVLEDQKNTNVAAMLEAASKEVFGEAATKMHDVLHKMSGGSTIDPSLFVPVQEMPKRTGEVVFVEDDDHADDHVLKEGDTCVDCDRPASYRCLRCTEPSCEECGNGSALCSYCNHMCNKDD